MPADVARDDLVCEVGRTQLFRRHLTDGTILFCQRSLGASNARRRVHELEIFERLRGVRGVPQLSRPWTAPDLLVFDDVGACLPLTIARPDPGAWPSFLRLAEELARTLGSIHRRGIVHGSIEPASLLLAGPEQTPLFVSFELASSVAEGRPGFGHHSEIAGPLAYLAPEQTGRTGRSVDQRADLYALGATLYHLACAHPPFEADDPLQLLHDLLTRIPEPLRARSGHIPGVLSEIVARLLEKEPDRRYQSAEGLAHDLARLSERLACGDESSFPLGERDFPLRLAAPSRLVGREAEIAVLRDALDEMQYGAQRGILVAGAPGVGKTALVNELKPLVAARGGWFVSGKFDQHRRDVATDAVNQAVRAIGRLLLAEPESELDALRARMLDALGPNVWLITTLLPEFAALLDTHAADESSDSTNLEGRLIQAGLDLMRTIVSPDRPIVMVLDDLQWATSTPINFIDALLMDGGLRGLLVLGAYREADVDAAHPLAAMLSRWERLGAAPRVLHLNNLPPDGVTTLLEGVLRLEGGPIQELAAVLRQRTGGNPYDTVELVNGLRHDGLLTTDAQGWSWDAAAIRGYVSQGDVLDLLGARIACQPPSAEELVNVMACLGGEVSLELLAEASGGPRDSIEERLAPALEDGLIVPVHAAGTGFGFRHDRVQQAAYGRLAPALRRGLHLQLARNLAAFPEREPLAAAQYLQAIDAIEAPEERFRAAVLMREAANAARLLDLARADRLLSAALSLQEDTRTPEQLALVAELLVLHHAVLYDLARLEQADKVYREIERHFAEPHALAAAACVQISSLCNRHRHADALAIGFRLLAQLGFETPGDDVSAEVARGLPRLYEWFSTADRPAELAPAENRNVRALSAARLINRLMVPAFLQHPMAAFWLVLQAQRLWTDYGPCAAMVGPLSYAGFLTIALREDFHTCHRALRHVLAVSELHGYEAESAHARFLFAVSIAHWSEPLQDGLPEARRAREGLLRAGDLQNACYAYLPTIIALLDSAPKLESVSEEVDAALNFAARTGNEPVALIIVAYRQLLRALRGETREPGGFDDASFDEGAHRASCGEAPLALYHTCRALAAALVGRTEDLIHHAGAAMPLLAYIPAAYTAALAHTLQGLALAERLRRASGDERERLCEEFDRTHHWLERRAVDAPFNFLHLSQLLEAERAFALGDSWGAAQVFDRAMREVEGLPRPWHRALITERAARFYLSQGLEQTGRGLLASASRHYEAWGAIPKARALWQASGWTGEHDRVRHLSEPAMRADSVDLLAILRASQTLSSETNLERLRARVAELLGSITGATSIRMVLWRDEPRGFYVPASAAGRPELSLEEAGAHGLLPLSALRYAERTRRPLVIADAKRDDRFARDRYFARVEQCSLLVVPVLRQDVTRALLLLENHQSRGAFSAERLDAVMLISGQLAVSLENALLYASLERKVEERTLELTKANNALQAHILHRKQLESQLVQSQKLESLGQLAAGMAHEINTPLQFVSDNVHFLAEGFAGVAPLIARYRAATEGNDELRVAEERADVDYLLEQLPSALRAMSEGLTRISAIVRGMKDFAHPSGKEKSATDLNRNIQSTLTIARGEWKYVAEVETELGDLPAVRCHAGEINQAFLNIVVNASHAIADVVGDSGQKGTIRVRSYADGDDVMISIQDTGGGIPAEIRHRIFDPFFTTKGVGRGTGQGLAIAYAIVVHKHGGSLTLESEVGRGTTFFIRLPIDGGKGRDSKLLAAISAA